MRMKKLWNVSNKSMVMFKFSFIIAVLVGLVVFIGSVFAAHTSSVSIEPEFAQPSQILLHNIKVKNKGEDSIKRVWITKPIDYTNLVCGDPPEGWGTIQE